MSDDLEPGVFDSIIGSASHDRRTFLRRLVIGTAFAVPIVSSFSMTGLAAAISGPQGTSSSNQLCNTNMTGPWKAEGVKKGGGPTGGRFDRGGRANERGRDAHHVTNCNQIFC